MFRPLLLAALLCSAVVANAQNANDPREFANGPAQWIMNEQDRRDWKAIAGTSEAQAFIELFWARRDPTPGTLQNEYRDKFNDRVAYADKNFVEGKRRGSLTDRGRVIVSLGFPTSLGSEERKTTRQQSLNYESGTDITGGRQLAGRDTWTWSYKDSQQYDLPKIEVVFIHDKNGGGARRDPLRPDFMTALPVAIRKAVVSPELTAVPDWARPQLITGPERRVIQTRTEAPAKQGTTITTTTRTILDERREVARPKGAGKLILMGDPFSLDSQGAADPLSGLQSLSRFSANDELGFAAEYCAGVVTEELNGLTMRARISGGGNGQLTNLTGAAEEVVPDSIKAAPGCHLVRGAVPLATLTPGNYTLSLDLVSPLGTYQLTREFRVE